MSRTDFTLTYDGPSLRSHEMDVRELAPAMLAVGGLFDAINILLNGEMAEGQIRVKAHETGCFSIVFDIVQGWRDGAMSLLTGDVVTAAIKFKELLIGATGLVWWVLKKSGSHLTRLKNFRQHGASDLC